MITITLIRHGRSLIESKHKLTANEYTEWVKLYDKSGVVVENTYPEETISSIMNAKLIVTSDLSRSICSAKQICENKEMESFSIFRELELPTLSVKKIKFTPKTWTLLARIAYFLGYSHKRESHKDAQVRAVNAAKQLIEMANQHQSIVLLGHGLFNKYIAKQLRKNGFRGKRYTSSIHWRSTTYRKGNDDDINND